MEYFLQGLTMGLAYVAPIGVQNLFVINSALTQNRLRALLTALIVIFFDITLALACFFGIGVVMENYHWLQAVVKLFRNDIETKQKRRRPKSTSIIIAWQGQ